MSRASNDDRYERWKRENVTRDPEMCGGQPTLRGTRLRVRFFGKRMLLAASISPEVLREEREHERIDRSEVTDEDVEFMTRFARDEPLEESEKYRNEYKE